MKQVNVTAAYRSAIVRFGWASVNARNGGNIQSEIYSKIILSNKILKACG
jgi:hypothetical protein